jgi:hypothetical protein
VFYSDELDRSLGVLGRVFGHLNDIGRIFQRARKTTPNVYGPIQLVFAPAVFSSMRDICITPKSIVNLDQNWRQHALLSEEKIEDLLRVDRSHNQINSAFSFCELSCSNNSISLEYLKCVRVEPLRLSNWSLLEIVENELRTYGIRVPVEARPYARVENREALQQLVNFCERLSIPHSREALPLPVTSLPATFQALERSKKRRLILWCRYFTHGTIKPLRHDAKWEPDEGEDYTICQLCAPGDERPPPKVSYSFIRGGQWGEFVLGEGHCDWCGGVSVRCESCGIVHPVPDAQYDVPIECDGECGLRFAVRQEEDGLAHVELMLSIEDEKMLYGYGDEDESPYWEGEDDEESPY